MEKMKKTGVHLPDDMIGEILTHLPVKSLLQFKSVSKSCYSTISQLHFAGAYIRRRRRCRQNNNDGFLIGSVVGGKSEPELIGLTKDWQVNKSSTPMPLKPHPEIPHPYKKLCCGDGLTVGFTGDTNTSKIAYAVWNPSTRALIEFECPYNSLFMRDLSSKMRCLFGLGYDPVMNEYKFLIWSGSRYAIFYCRNKMWSEVRNVEEESILPMAHYHNGMDYSKHYGYFSESDGDFYWQFFDIDLHPFIQLVCFDATQEKLKKLPDVPCAISKIIGFSKLWTDFVASEEGNLALFCSKPYWNNNGEEEEVWKVFELKRGGGGGGDEEEEYWWETIMDGVPKLPSGYIQTFPLYLGIKADGMVLLNALRGDDPNERRRSYNRCCLLVYNIKEKTFKEIHNGSSYLFYRFIPLEDNLFFSSPETGGQRGMDSTLRFLG